MPQHDHGVILLLLAYKPCLSSVCLPTWWLLKTSLATWYCIDNATCVKELICMAFLTRFNFQEIREYSAAKHGKKEAITLEANG